MQEIKITSHPRYKDAPPEGCIHYLSVNGYTVGTYYGGEDKKYEYPEKWASKQVPKRISVLKRNIERLEKELVEFQKEYEALKTY